MEKIREEDWVQPGDPLFEAEALTEFLLAAIDCFEESVNKMNETAVFGLHCILSRIQQCIQISKEWENHSEEKKNVG